MNEPTDEIWAWAEFQARRLPPFTAAEAAAAGRSAARLDARDRGESLPRTRERAA